ncbi:TfoX/Sxy family protein [Bifidobacterium catenulatum]|uniref:TfoX/Sxy family protein n=1 Tax=Bifidobacterium catenulatum TaxID=1686 RepID=UPI0025464304|nr:TfoX/Sxy family protein [Bifidobacterium catenulatum]
MRGYGSDCCTFHSPVKNKYIDWIQLPNIGNAVANQLKQVGILDEDDLKSIGAEQAWLKIQQIDKTACINKLYALEGAILGIKKTLLPNERKEALREFYNRYKK